MAKKDDDDDTGGDKSWVIFWLILLGIVFVGGGGLYYFGPVIGLFTVSVPFFFGTVQTIFDFLIVISFPVALIFFIGIIVSIERLKLIRQKEKEIYNPPELPESAEILSQAGKIGVKSSPETVNRWRKIVALSDSDNQNDWKQAIIDADSILDEMLTAMNYIGDDLGSKLRSATTADFKNLKQAGEAHGVRNRIAHDGSNFMLSKHETKRIVNIYKQVFEEFFYI
jgi:hypothetical protein